MLAFEVSMLFAKVETSPVEQNRTTLTALVLRSEMALFSGVTVWDAWAQTWLFLYNLILMCPVVQVFVDTHLVNSCLKRNKNLCLISRIRIFQ